MAQHFLDKDLRQAVKPAERPAQLSARFGIETVARFGDNSRVPASLPEWLNLSLPPDVSFPGGLLVAAPLVVGFLAAGVSLPLLWLMDRAQLARFVWHPPLFTLGFYGLIYAILGLWLLPR